MRTRAHASVANRDSLHPGLSRFFDERKLMRTICGTHKYLAPELVQTDRGQLQGYDKAIDMCARCHTLPVPPSARQA